MTAATEPGPRADRVTVVAAGLAATVPILVSLIRALRRGWYPVGDNAYFSLRAGDVLTTHHPLLGTWTSASLSVGQDMNNPGPLHWDLLALPAKIAPVAGIAVAAVVVNVVCIVAMAYVAHRRGGSHRCLGVLAAASALGWAMGSELVIDPWQPHALLFPFLLFLVLVWGLVEGDAVLLPAAVGVASLLVQTHLSYAVLVVALGALGVGAVAARGWFDRRRNTAGWPAERRRLVRIGAVAVLVGLVCWAQPLVEQVTADDGNLSRLVRNGGGGDEPRVGSANAARILADVTAVPPAWSRPSFARAFAQEANPADGGIHFLHVPSSAASLAGLVALAALLAGATWLARRRRDAGALAGVALVAVALALAWLTTAVLPIGPSGFGLHQVRWLWPISILTLLVVVLAAGGSSRWVGRGLAAAAVVLGVAALPRSDQVAGPSVDAEAMAVMTSIDRQLDGVELDGPVLFAVADLRQMSLYEPYSTPMMLEMERRGIGFVVDDPSQARQVGESRLHPEEAKVRMVLLQGDRIRQPPPGGRRLAVVDGVLAVYVVPLEEPASVIEP